MVQTWMNRGLGLGLALMTSLCSSSFAADPQPPSQQEFTDQWVRDFNLRSVGEIQLTNLRGNISVQGWSQDKIRVLAHRRVFAENELAAKREFSAMDLRFREQDNEIECSAQYGHDLDIHQRIEERNRPIEYQAKMDMVVYAPSRLKLKIWTDTGTLSLKSWNNSAELRTISGDISAESIRGPRLSSLCQNCSARFKAIKGSVRAISDGGNLFIEDVDGAEVFLETAAGNISVQNAAGDQLYVTKAGNVSARNLRGRVEFQTQQGSVDLLGLRGFASGKTESGTIQMQASEWEFHDKALIESVHGNISLSLPKNFAAEVDLRSSHGKVGCAFPIQQTADQRPQAGHINGRIGELTSDSFRVFSESGNIEIQSSTR